MATCRTSPFQDGEEVLKCHEWRCQGIKRRFRNLNIRKSTSRRILRGMLSKKSENLSQILALNVWESGVHDRSIRSRINKSKILDLDLDLDLDKTRVKLFPNFTSIPFDYLLIFWLVYPQNYPGSYRSIVNSTLSNV